MYTLRYCQGCNKETYHDLISVFSKGVGLGITRYLVLRCRECGNEIKEQNRDNNLAKPKFES